MQVTGGDSGYISLMSPPTDYFGFIASKYSDAGISSSKRRDGLHIYPPTLSHQIYANIAICIDVVATKDTSPRPSKEDFAYFFKEIMHTLHKGVNANFSQVVTRICGRDLSPPSEYSTFSNQVTPDSRELRLRVCVYFWKYLHKKYVLAGVHASAPPPDWTSFPHDWDIFRIREYSRFSYMSRHLSARTLTWFVRFELELVSSLNSYWVGGIWEAGDASLNRGRSPPYLQLLLSSRLERRENRVALAAIRESTHPILSKPLGKEKKR